MSQARQEGREPRTNARRAYERCLSARQQWRATRAKTVNEQVRDEAHGDLQEAVLVWFETLVPYISERPGEVKQLWENAPLYPIRQATVRCLACPDGDNCGFMIERERDDHELAPGDICPECDQGYPLEPDQLVQLTENGEEMYEWACGLKRLSSWSSATEKTTIESSQWETGSREVEVPKRLDPDVLLRAARFLDLAAEECGLLEDTDDAIPTGEL